jgi:hypothetical protein
MKNLQTQQVAPKANSKLERSYNMHQKLRFLIGIAFVLLLASPVFAQEPIEPRHTDPFWQVSYWNNMTLSGEPVVQGTDAHLDWDWGSGSPHASVNADYFSARWLRYIDVSPATYRFTATSDDGIQVWVDGDLIIDRWTDHPPTTYTAQKTLGAGHHLVKVEYYENRGGAVAKLSWTQITDTIHYWRGEYYNNKSLSGSPNLVRDDPDISFSWSGGSPAPGQIDADGFSVRWTHNLDLPAGNYRFRMTVDDGARLYVNGHLLIDAWKDQPPRTYSGDIYLPSGSVTVQMEYYENRGHATAKLSWELLTTPPLDDAVIVDDADAGFVKGGSSTGWRAAAEGYSGHLTWARNNDRSRPNYNWARWYPELAAGHYEVFVYIPKRYTTTSQARYWVSHRDGYTLRIVDQSANDSRWVSLGTYWFCGVLPYDHVSLSDVTYEPYQSRLIAFDAVKWVPR